MRPSALFAFAALPFSSAAVTEVAAPQPYTQTVVRDVLASGEPAQTKGQLLELVRFTIAPHAELPVHAHPGMQIEQLVEGQLTYTVVEGAAQVTKADGTPMAVRTGETVELTAGDSLVEAAGMVHCAKNSGDRPVVLLSASLLPAHQPKAIMVELLPIS